VSRVAEPVDGRAPEGIRGAVTAVRALASARPEVTRLVLAALVVMVAYWVGAKLGALLKFPDATPSVLWPPNAILTATLLLAPPRWWIVLLLAAFPAHLMVVAVGSRPIALVLSLFVTNCSEAVIAAAGMLLFRVHPVRFDSLRRVAVFVGSAALAAPFLSSFADAGVVAALHSDPFWSVWRTRFFANVLTELTLVPAIVALVTQAPRALRRLATLRAIEAVVLAAGLALALSVFFGGRVEKAIGLPPAPTLVLVLPFFLWAAVRFHPGYLAFTLLVTTVVAIDAEIRGLRPFPLLPPRESVLALQIFLSGVAIPLLCLSGAIQERHRASAGLRDRLRFEALISALSSTFVHVPNDDLGRAFDTWLARLGRHFALDRVTLFRFPRQGCSLSRVHDWQRTGVAAGPAHVPLLTAPRVIARLLDAQTVIHPGDGTRDVLNGPDVAASATVPLVSGDHVLGALAFVTITQTRRWPDHLVQRLHLVSAVLATAIARQETESALRASESMKSAILDSVTSHSAMLDEHGVTTALSEGTRRFATTGDESWDAGVRVGDSYLEACHHAARNGVAGAAEAAAGLEAVLERRCESFAFTYPSRVRGAERWVAMSVVPLDRPSGGAVVTYTDVTERKHAEVEVQRSREELAHVSRVSTMGALAASLAHELNQPLTGIVANAQAAQRLLAGAGSSDTEFRAILADIVEDGRRAGEVIRRLRELLQKGPGERKPIDVDALVNDVVRLLRHDALIRDVTISVVSATPAAIVVGDRIQLQQVILNLLVNALEALGDSPPEHRRVVVRTRTTPGENLVAVSVEDTGPGLHPDHEQWLFQPFHTTKPSGMGVGLSISRTIVEAHGGTLDAMNNADRGATFRFNLPLRGFASS
jgi:C4-dicarboxylate-specific signal transduction histidine kinase/integral membrane sensor domain MASE1